MDQYRVLIVSALPIELACMTAMLDVRYEDKQAHLDGNTYTYGRIGQHNVVLACLPKGVTGNVSSATVVTRAFQSFQRLKFCLFVGIGGGAPDMEGKKQHDIRLGDIVVQTPNETNGGIVHYRMGKTVPHISPIPIQSSATANYGVGGFQRTGSMNRPPDFLLTAVADLQARHLLSSSRVNELLSTLLLEHPEKASSFCYQGTENDQLFQARYDHQSYENTCALCDKSYIVDRPNRTEEGPVIHYGTIATADEIMRHGETRERIASDIGVLCFEMEAAGPVNDYPCLVIRGISDYADSHKNKFWQPYAAAVASAYAKDLLLVIPAEFQESSPNTELKLTNLALNDDHDSQIALLFKTLNPVPVEGDVGKFRRDREQDTTSWVFDTPEFGAWKGTKSRVLWLNGAPGSGKSVICASIYQNLNLERDKSQKDTVAVFFCRHDDPRKRQCSEILRRLIYDVAVQSQEACEMLTKRLNRENRLGKPKTIRSISDNDLFEIYVKETLGLLPDSSRLFWIIDGLDELTMAERSPFLSFAKDLSCLPHVSILIAGRNESDVSKFMRTVDGLSLTTSDGANSKDIATCIQSWFRTWRYRDEAIQKEVGQVLLQRSNGMFLWVKLIFEQFDNLHDLESIKQELYALPKDLQDLYEQCLRRIAVKQPDRALGIVRNIFSWMVHTFEPLSLEQLYSALKNEIGSTTINAFRSTVNDLCGSLIRFQTVDICSANKDTVHFVHETFAQFLRSSLNENSPFYYDSANMNEKILVSSLSTLCEVFRTSWFYPANESEFLEMRAYNLINMRFVSFARHPEPDIRKTVVDENREICHKIVYEEYPFFQYALRNWTFHLQSVAQALTLARSTFELLTHFLSSYSSRCWLACAETNGWWHILDEEYRGVPFLMGLRDKEIQSAPHIAIELMALKMWSRSWRNHGCNPGADLDMLGDGDGPEYMDRWKGIQPGLRDPDEPSPSNHQMGLPKYVCIQWNSGVASSSYTKTTSERCNCLMKSFQFEESENFRNALAYYLHAFVVAPECFAFESSTKILELSTAHFEELFTLVFDYLWQYINFSRLLIRAGFSAEAIDLLDHVVRDNPKSSILAEQYAIALETEGDLNEASKFYDEARAKFPDDHAFVEGSIRVWHRSKDYDRIIHALEVRKQGFPGENPWLLYRICHLHKKARNLEGAIRTAREGMKSSLQSKFYKPLGTFLLDKGQIQEYVDHLYAAKKNNNCAKWASDSLIEKFVRDHDYHAAMDEMEDHIRSFPTDTESYALIWKWIEQLMPISLCEDLLLRVADKYLEFWCPQVYLARFYIDQGRFNAAISRLKVCPKSDGDHIVAYTLGVALREAGQHRASLEALECESPHYDLDPRWIIQRIHSAFDSRDWNLVEKNVNEYEKRTMRSEFSFINSLFFEFPKQLPPLEHLATEALLRQKKYDECEARCGVELALGFDAKIFALLHISMALSRNQSVALTNFRREIEDRSLGRETLTYVGLVAMEFNDELNTHDFAVACLQENNRLIAAERAESFEMRGPATEQYEPQQLRELKHIEGDGQHAIPDIHMFWTRYGSNVRSYFDGTIQTDDAFSFLAECIKSANSSAISALQAAVLLRSLEVVRFVLASGLVDVNHVGNFRASALSIATITHFDEAISWLLYYGADPMSRDMWGLTCLDWAVERPKIAQAFKIHMVGYSYTPQSLQITSLRETLELLENQREALNYDSIGRTQMRLHLEKEAKHSFEAALQDTTFDVGVKHTASCSACANSKPIVGLRYVCQSCFCIDLCESCMENYKGVQVLGCVGHDFVRVPRNAFRFWAKQEEEAEAKESSLLNKKGEEDFEIAEIAMETTASTPRVQSFN